MNSKPSLVDLSFFLLLLLVQYLTCCYSFLLISTFSIPRGIHPLDEKYYALEVIKCKDGSNSFTRDRLNDDFCDCPDGTDEPGTSACPAGKFYCQNLGSKPQFIHSSRINDRICDCCDGSDEYDGAINCPNTCIMGGNVHYKTIRHITKSKDPGSVLAKEYSKGVEFDDLLQKVKGLKIVIILQLVVICCVALFRIFRRRARSKRKPKPEYLRATAFSILDDLEEAALSSSPVASQSVESNGLPDVGTTEAPKETASSKKEVTNIFVPTKASQGLFTSTIGKPIGAKKTGNTGGLGARKLTTKASGSLYDQRPEEPVVQVW